MFHQFSSPRIAFGTASTSLLGQQDDCCLIKERPATTLPPEEERPGAHWKTWLWPYENVEGPLPLRIILVLDYLTGHRSPDLLSWFFHKGVMPHYTTVSGSWLNMAVGAAHHCPSSPLRSASPQRRAGYQLIGANSEGVEYGTHPFQLERQAT